MPIFSQSLVVLDTETTGFPSHPWASVIEIAGVRLSRDGEEIDTFSAFCLPAVLDARADKALEINQITREMLVDKPAPEAVGSAFAEWVADDFVTAFNVDFDRPMCERMGLRSLRWASCVMLRAMAVMGPAGVLRAADPTHPRYQPGRPWLWPSLAAAGDHFGVPPCEPAHRALSDARRAAGVAVAIQRLSPPSTAPAEVAQTGRVDGGFSGGTP